MQHLLEHFKDLTLLPKNAAELKGLILHLAIQGKLTGDWRKENPREETASVVLKQIEVERHKLEKDRKIKKQPVFTVITKAEIPFELPKSWTWCRWGDLLGFVDYPMKRGPFGSALRKEYFVAEGIRVFEQYNPINDDPHWVRYFISEEKYEELKAFTAVEGDILISCSGTLGRIGELPLGTQKGIINQALLKLTLHPRVISNQFFIQLFRSFFMQTRIYDEAMGSAITNMVGVKELKQFLIPLPPLEEQKAIVATVNQLFAEVELLEAATKKRIQLKEDFVSSALRRLSTEDTASAWAYLLPQFKTFFTEKSSIKKLRESILQMAVQGKLTRDFRKSHPELCEGTHSAEALLERIKSEKSKLIKEGKIKKEKPLPAITEDEIPYELPEGWVWCRFQEIFDIRDGTHDSPKDSNGSNSYPLITSKNFKDSQIDFESARRISEEDYLKVIQRSKVHTGDILFSMIGGNIGNQVEVGEFTEFAIKNVALFKHYQYGLPQPGFLRLFSQFIAMSLQSDAAGGAQPFIALKFFRNLIIGLPPMEEQKSIMQKVNALMALCDRLEKEIETQKTTQEEWMQSCLREVFEG